MDLRFSVRRRNPGPSAGVATACLTLDLESGFRKGENGEGISMIVKHAIPYVPLLRTREAGLYHGPVGPEHHSATRSLPTADQLLFDRGVIGAGGCGRQQRRNQCYKNNSQFRFHGVIWKTEPFMEWISYDGGQFAKYEHGFYFIYKKFNFALGIDRWFAEYQPRTAGFGERREPIADVWE